MKKALSSNKKGISSVFLAIYLGLIAMTLGVALFSSIQISNISLIERLRIEQEKEQEAILLQIGSLTVIDNKICLVRVNNTGSITVRIRGIYIGYSLVQDLSTTHASINAQKSLEIDISAANVPLDLNQFLPITITTERGTIFTSIINDLLIGTLTEQGWDTVYGPIRLIWEQFHWTNFIDDFDLNFLRSKDTQWYGGWKTPPNDYVIWRIRVQNVDKDNREIQLGNKSCLTLVSNEVGSRYTFFLDFKCSDNTIRSKEYSTIYFVWQTPEPDKRVQSSATKTPQVTGPGSARTCITFLLFEGQIGGTPLGETIPFEAVLMGT